MKNRAANSAAVSRGAGDATKLIVGQLVMIAVLLASGIVIARVLGSVDYGRFAAIVAAILILQTLSSMGLNQVAIRYLAPQWRSGQRGAKVLAASLWGVRWSLAAIAGVVAFLWIRGNTSLGVSDSLTWWIGALCGVQCAYDAVFGLYLPTGYAGTSMLLDLVRVSLRMVAIVGAYLLFGFEGVFVALVALTAALALLSSIWFGLKSRVAPQVLLWRPLRPYLRFAFSSSVSGLATVLQHQIATLVIAIWGAAQEAAFLAISMQLNRLPIRVFNAGVLALMPVMSEFEERDQNQRLHIWGELILRYGTACSMIIIGCWVLVGDLFVQPILGVQYAPVYRCATVFLLGLSFMGCSNAARCLLVIRGRPGIEAILTIARTTVLVCGMMWVVATDQAHAAVAMAWAYVASEATDAILGFLALRRFASVRLPVVRAICLAWPILMVGPALVWNATPGTKFVGLLVFVALYLLLAMAGSLLPSDELKRLAALVKDSLLARESRYHEHS